MVFAELDRRTRQAQAFRIKLGVQMLTTSAYGTIGGALVDPVLNGGSFDPGRATALAFGLVCGFLALYYVPEGDRDGVL